MGQQIFIKELEKNFKDVKELIEYVITQNKALLYSTERIRNLEEQLGKKDQKVIQAQQTTAIARTIPEALCIIEIERLMEKAAITPLDFEDTKKFDLLVKNYYVIQEKEKGLIIPEKDKRKADITMTDEELTKMAIKE